MDTHERVERIQELEAIRNSRVIVYITSTRDNAQAQMAMDVVPRLHDHLRAIGHVEQLDLFIHSYGGDGVVPWRIVNLTREFCDRLSLLVPAEAFSAATLTALGSDEVVMHPMGVLGPTDPTVSNAFNPSNPSNPQERLGISVEDVASFITLVKKDVGITHEDELVQAFLALTQHVHPLALGNVKRSTQQSRMMGEKLLRLRKDPMQEHDVRDVIERLTSQLYYHGHPISRREAREDLGLDFVRDASDEEAEAMWNLFATYSDAMRLRDAFDPVSEILAAHPLAVPDITAGQPNIVTGQTQPVYIATVESTHHVDYYERVLEGTLLRQPNGEITVNFRAVQEGWKAAPH